MARGMRRDRRAAACALAAVWLVAALPVAAARAAAAPIAQAGRIATGMEQARRHLDADPSARRLFEIGQLRNHGGMRIEARDLDTLEPAGAVDLAGAQSGYGGMLSTLDELRHRLYVLYPVRHADDTALRNVLGSDLASGVEDEGLRVLFGVAAVDTLRMEIAGTGTLVLPVPAVPQDRGESNRIGIKALSYFREGGRDLLYLASEVPTSFGNLTVSNHSVVVSQVDVQRLFDLTTTTTAVDWSYVVPQCAALMARDTPSVIFRSPSTPTVSLACRQGGAQGLIAGQPGETPGIVQVRIVASATQATVAQFVPSFHAISGNLQYGVVALDPLAERMFLQIDGSNTEAAIWVFDIPSATFIGLVSLPPEFAAGGTSALTVDPSLGRLYAISQLSGDKELRHTVLITSTDTPVVDQGLLTSFRSNPTPIKRKPTVDTFRHRLYLTAAEGTIVLQDSMPRRPRDSGGSKPDDATVDVAESDRTAVNFLGGGQAYGARIRWVGGSGGVDRNVNTYLDPPPSELSPQTGGILPPPPAPGTRDVHFARVIHATLTNGESSAKATGAERDLDNTDADLGGMANYLRRWGGPDLADQRWPYPVVDCTDFGNSNDVRDGKGYGASTSCRYRDARVTALAVDESLSHGPVVRMAQARARTVVQRDRRRGVVSISEAEILGLDLGGVAGAGRVLARAETWATGRPKSANKVGAGSTFTRLFEDVWIVGPDGAKRSVCGNVCDPVAARDAINRALGVRARVDLPQPEPMRAKGSSGGFEALIVRDQFERANEASVNLESDERRLEVPALVVTVFADGRVPSRVVVSLAGVSAESHYGIFLLSQAAPFRGPRPAPGGGGSGSAGVPGAQTEEPGAAAPGGLGSLVRKSIAGIRFVFASPARAARVFAMLALFAGPLVLLTRRRSAGG